MLYDSTKVLLRNMVCSLENTGAVGWDEQFESGRQCLFETHQLARPSSRAYRPDPAAKKSTAAPVNERAARAIPHLKTLMRAIRRKDQPGAIESSKAALAEM